MPSTTGKLKAAIRHIRQPAWICFVWFGLAAGVSLLAVPAVFSAGTADRVVSLDVARSMFLVLSKAEFVLLILLLITVRVSGLATSLWAWAAVLALIMIAQGAWLIPELSARTDSIIRGVEPPPSIAHAAYSISGLVKLALLLWLGFRTLPGESSRA